MKCTCPKCQAKIELDLPEVTEAGSSAVCPSCNGRFTVYRESFAGRALQHSGQISCAPCGSELGTELFCPACGAQYPDYLVAAKGRKRVRKDTVKVKLNISPFPKRTAAPVVQLPSLDALAPEGKAKPRAALADSGSRVRILAGALVLIVLVAAGGVFYGQQKAAKQYKSNFVLATYCLVAGADRIAKENAKIATDWKARAAAGLSFTARPSAEFENDLNIVDRKLQDATSKLTNPPEKFAAARGKLANLEVAYGKLHALIITPGNSLQTFTEASAKGDADFKQAAKDFKASMPQEMMDELLAATKRYRSLKLLF